MRGEDREQRVDVDGAELGATGARGFGMRVQVKSPSRAGVSVPWPSSGVIALLRQYGSVRVAAAGIAGYQTTQHPVTVRFDQAPILGGEKELYIGLCERWRNIPKPTIAAVQRRCIMGGLMLIWPCDIIIASEDAQFVDHATSFSVNGVEYLAHPWEMGARKPRNFSSPATQCPPPKRA